MTNTDGHLWEQADRLEGSFPLGPFHLEGGERVTAKQEKETWREISMGSLPRAHTVPSLAHVPLGASVCGTVGPPARGPQGIRIPLSPAVLDQISQKGTDGSDWPCRGHIRQLISLLPFLCNSHYTSDGNVSNETTTFPRLACN